MFTLTELETILAARSPLLTVYVQMGPPERPQRGVTTGSLAWIKNESRLIAAKLAVRERASFQKQLDRVQNFLKTHTPHEKTVVIFAGSKLWRVIPLQMQLRPALHWGKPAIAQLVSVLSEQKAYGLLVVDHRGARFLRYHAGELSESHHKKFFIDTSQWKKKDLGHVTGQNVAKSRGTQRDVFKKRVENRYALLSRAVARESATFCAENDLVALFVVGPDKLLSQIQHELTGKFPLPIVFLNEELATEGVGEIKAHIEPEIVRWERLHESELVNAVRNAQHGAVAGFDETFTQLQRGRLRVLILAQGLDAELHRCVSCGWADRSADPICFMCGGNRSNVGLWDVLPALSRQNDVEIQVVSSEAAEALKSTGGMAGWLRQPKAMKAGSGR